MTGERYETCPICGGGRTGPLRLPRAGSGSVRDPNHGIICTSSWHTAGPTAASGVTDNRWQMVTCEQCGVTYRCTPGNDFYERAADGKMVCEPCLLGYSRETSRELHRQYEHRQSQ